MYTLYYTTRSYTLESTALIPRIALEEIGAPYRVIAVELEPRPPAWYLEINPHGKIPTLTMDQGKEELSKERGTHTYPSAAILLTLADAHKDADLLPSSATQRAACYVRLFDMVEQFHAGFMQRLFAERYSTDDAHIEHIQKRSLQWIMTYMKATESDLAHSEFIASDQYTICDIYFYVMIRWYLDLRSTDDIPAITEFPNINRYCHQVERRSAVIAALKADKLDTVTGIY